MTEIMNKPKSILDLSITQLQDLGNRLAELVEKKLPDDGTYAVIIGHKESIGLHVTNIPDLVLADCFEQMAEKLRQHYRERN